MLKGVSSYRSIANLFPKSKFIYQQQVVAALLKNSSTIEELESIYATMIKTSAHHDFFLINQFIISCSTHGRLDYAITVFNNTQNPNVFVYNAMIAALVQCSYPLHALDLYLNMLRSDISPSSYTFSSLIEVCSVISDLQFGQAIHGQIWRRGLVSHVYVQTAMIEVYSRLGRSTEARKVFDEMPQRDVYAWTTMVSCGVRAGEISYARKVFDEMAVRNTTTWNCMLDGYARMGHIDNAEELFYQIPERDFITWTTMITCYTRHKKHRKAIEVFHEMKRSGVTPDEVTMATVISACAHIGELEIASSIHQYLAQNRFDVDVFIGSALIDMYAKCGSMDKSLMIFFKLETKNLFCWNAVIEGLAAHGLAKEALAMFDSMERENVTPNGVTFTSVLTACAHGGLVEQGRDRFSSMSRDYSIRPSTKHYGCMVELLAKAGLLDDALALIRDMDVEPNSVIWCSLLGGCKLYKNIDIAKLVVGELVCLEPYNRGYYTLLVNMLAEANRWSEVAEVREMMNDQGIEKSSPASTWIQVERNCMK